MQKLPLNMPRWKIRLFSHVGLLSGPRAKIRTPCHQPPPHHLQNLISSTHYPTLHPYPLLFRLLSPFSPLCYEQVRAAGHRRWAAKADPPPPPPSGVTAVGASNWQWGLLRRLGFRLFLFFWIFLPKLFSHGSA